MRIARFNAAVVAILLASVVYDGSTARAEQNVPGSVLVFPYVDTSTTIVSITNTYLDQFVGPERSPLPDGNLPCDGSDPINGKIGDTAVHLIFFRKSDTPSLDCTHDDFFLWLSPQDHASFRLEDVGVEGGIEGWLVAFAAVPDPDEENGDPVPWSFDFLAGQAWNADAGSNFTWSYNAYAFLSVDWGTIPSEEDPCDRPRYDADQFLNFDGETEYERWPDILLLPRFFEESDGGAMTSSLVTFISPLSTIEEQRNYEISALSLSWNNDENGHGVGNSTVQRFDCMFIGSLADFGAQFEFLGGTAPPPEQNTGWALFDGRTFREGMEVSDPPLLGVFAQYNRTGDSRFDAGANFFTRGFNPDDAIIEYIFGVDFADIAVEKTADKYEVEELEYVTFDVTVTNNGPNDATGVEVTDLLPETLTLDTATPSQGSYDPGSGEWSIGSLPVGASVVLTLVAFPNDGTAGMEITNVAEVTRVLERDNVEENDRAEKSIRVVGFADIEVKKDVDEDKPKVFEEIEYTLEARNLGPDDATGVTVADPLPSELTLVDAMGDGSYDGTTWTVGDIPAGTEKSIVIRATVNAMVGGEVVNTATLATVDQTDDNDANDSDSATIHVRTIDIKLLKTQFPHTAAEGEIVLYTLTALNLSLTPASNVLAQDMLPKELEFLFSTGAGMYDGMCWDIDEMIPIVPYVHFIFAKVKPGTAGSEVTNTVEFMSADQVDTDSGNDSSSTTLTIVED